MKPMMMKKWKCASMVPLVMHHEPGRAEDQPAGHEERREPPLLDGVATDEGDHGGDQRVADDGGPVAEPQAEQRQRGHVQQQDPLQQPVPPLPGLVVEHVAARQVGQETGHTLVTTFEAAFPALRSRTVRRNALHRRTVRHNGLHRDLLRPAATTARRSRRRRRTVQVAPADGGRRNDVTRIGLTALGGMADARSAATGSAIVLPESPMNGDFAGSARQAQTDPGPGPAGRKA